ncbi:MAG: serine/threonine-protein kinase, partial [Planctomycetota bacterium]
MRDHPTVETSVLIQIIGEDQRLSEENEFRGLETYLQKIPELKEDSEAVLEAMYSEWLILEEAGESIDGESYIKCFPDLEEEIRRQLQVHQALKFDESVEIGLCDTPEANADATVREVIEAPPAQPEFDDLQIGKLAGKGGMGVVFLGRSKTLGRDVAVKVLSRSVQPDSAEARRMEREARIVASLDDPNIVKIYDVRRDQNGLPVILMEYVDGGTLARKLANGPLPPREAASILEAIAGGLATAHASDLIHRDLKPANILLTKDGSPKVADFGLARAIEPGSINATTMTNFVGTPSYVSPEQARAEPSAIRPASDVYSLGVILYETLTGRPPFQAATAWEVVSDILNEDITPIRQLNRRVPTDLETICHHCLERSVDRRYQNATELREDLKRYLDGRPILAKPTPLHRRIISWVKRHPSLSAAAGIAGVALLSIAAVSLRSSSKIRVSLDRTSAALEDAAMQRDVAVKAMNDLVYTVHDELQTREASIEARGEVLKSAMLGLQRV